MLCSTESGCVQHSTVVSKIPSVPGRFCWALSIEQINRELIVTRYSLACFFRIEDEKPHTSQVTHQTWAYPGFCSTKRLGVFLLPLDGILVHRRVTPSIKFVGTDFLTQHCESYLFCPRIQHTMSPSNQGRTGSARSGDECNLEATAHACHRFVAEGLIHDFL